jgi:hypothetical protein
MMCTMGDGSRRTPSALALRSAGVFAGAWLVGSVVAWIGVLLYGLGDRLAGPWLGALFFGVSVIGTLVYALLVWVGWLVRAVRPRRARVEAVGAAVVITVVANTALTLLLASDVSGGDDALRWATLATVVLLVPAGCGWTVATTALVAPHDPYAPARDTPDTDTSRTEWSGPLPNVKPSVDSPHGEHREGSAPADRLDG